MNRWAPVAIIVLIVGLFAFLVADAHLGHEEMVIAIVLERHIRQRAVTQDLDGDGVHTITIYRDYGLVVHPAGRDPRFVETGKRCYASIGPGTSIDLRITTGRWTRKEYSKPVLMECE